MGPFRIIFSGISLITMPEAARLLRRSPRQLPLFCAAASVGLTLLALLWGAVLLVALPRGLGQLMLGSLWRPAYPLVLPATLSVMSLLRHYRRAPGPARPGCRAPEPARRDPLLGARRSVCRRGSRDRQHARHDVLCRRRIVGRHAGGLAAVAACAAGVGHCGRTTLVVARPDGRTQQPVVRLTQRGRIRRTVSSPYVRRSRIRARWARDSKRPTMRGDTGEGRSDRS